MSSPDRLEWVSEPNGRGTINIIWGCLLVLFVCVWTVLHLNLPTKEDGYWTLFLRKMRWAILAVAGLEVFTIFAIMQWNAANISVKEMKRIGFNDWSAVHAFYANAGGFLLETPDFPCFPINTISIYHLCQNGWIEAPRISKENIWDRSKADLFAKGVAMVQAACLLVYTTARAMQHLSITPLELFTVAFTLPTVTTAFFWANKPQNVTEPTLIKVEWSIAEVLMAAEDAGKEPYVDTPMDFVEKPVWDGWKRRPSLLPFGGLNRRPLSRIPNGYSPPPPTGIEATFIWAISVAHAAIHVLGWSLSLPTAAEAILWRVCSLTLLVVMVIGGAVPVLSTRTWFDFSFNLLWIWVRDARRKTWVRKYLFDAQVNFAYAAYVLARLLMFAEMFISFRSTPADVYIDVNWTAILPHV